MHAPIAQWEDCWIAELTGSESPVRAALALAICSWLVLPAVGGSGHAKGKLTSVERGGPCPAVGTCGHVGYLEFPDRTVEPRTSATSSA